MLDDTLPDQADRFPPLASLTDVLRLPWGRYGRQFRPLVAAFAGVHRVAPHDPVPIHVVKDRVYSGRLFIHGGTGEAESIAISRYRNDQMEVSFAHELGHLVEKVLMPGANRGQRTWAFDSLMAPWLDRVRDSPTYGDLVRRRDGGTVGERAVAQKLLPEAELWARSYAQYMALRCGNEVLAGQIPLFCGPPYPYPLQWRREEFEPIGLEIDLIFSKIGWVP